MSVHNARLISLTIMPTTITTGVHVMTSTTTTTVAAPIEPTEVQPKRRVRKETAPDAPSLARAALAELLAFTADLKLRFLERDSVIDGMAAALIAGEHVLLTGVPGTAKSELTEAFCALISGEFFSYLCTRFGTPDEVFGPLSLKALQEDRLLRSTKHRLPEAQVVFLDEIFKGSSAMLNSMLKALNERTFEQDGQRVHLPLRLVVGASNELPDEGDGLGAFHDRFLMRFEVKPLAVEENARKVFFRTPPPPSTICLGEGALDALAAELPRIDVTLDAEDAVLRIRKQLAEAGVRVSDRRYKKSVKLLRAAAMLAGRGRVTSAGLSILEDCLWERPEQIAKVREVVRANVATWIKVTRDAQSAIDEQISRITDAGRKGGVRHESITALAKALDALVEIDNTMETLLKDHVEATDDVAAVRARITKAKVEVNSAMRVHGIGEV